MNRRSNSHRSRVTCAVVVAALLASCASESPSPTESVNTDGAAGRSIVVDQLDRPTQIADGPDGQLLVAQLAGSENDATGQILAVDVATGDRRVIADGLDKPTGVLWADGTLWVMVRRGLVSAPWNGSDATAGEFSAVLDGLPFNGRSEGTLTALADGTFLYETTGSLTNGAATPGSGTLWVFDPVDQSSRAIATGLKNAYAHVVLDDGRIVTTEIGDSADPPVEEINVIDPTQPPPDLGWPLCPGDTVCEDVVGPLATFVPASTPTGVTQIGNDVYVTLFVTGQLLRVPLAGWTVGSKPVTATEVVAGLEGPHTVLARPDGSLWVSEHLAGRIVEIRP